MENFVLQHSYRGSRRSKIRFIYKHLFRRKLNVTKTVIGNLGDKTKKFHFTVKFEKPENKDVKSDITATVAGTDKGILALDWTSGSCTYEFDLADGETASLGNIPYDVNIQLLRVTIQKMVTV